MIKIIFLCRYFVYLFFRFLCLVLISSMFDNLKSLIEDLRRLRSCQSEISYLNNLKTEIPISLKNIFLAPAAIMDRKRDGGKFRTLDLIKTLLYEIK